jgi:acetyl esterase/lipase
MVNLLFSISTVLRHYLNGPPKPSWDLKFHLIWATIKLKVENDSALTIEQVQRDSFRPVIPAPADVKINEFMINNKYRHEAQVYLDKILKPYEHILDSEWRNLNDDGINAEWVHVPNDGWEKSEIKKTVLYLHGGGYVLFSADSYRHITGSLAKKANARVLGKS